MNTNRQRRSCCMGNLPSSAPLANPYVPFQQATPQMYEPRKALVRGTLYTGLDLPFMGMVNKNEQKVTPTTQLQTLSFVIQDLALYLDTHRDDKEALQLYRTFQKKYQEESAKFEREYGPLTHQSVSENGYQWLDDPWPWEYARNKEV